MKQEKVLSFKDWLFREYAIDYDNVDVTEQTIEIWKEAYRMYLENKNSPLCRASQK